MFTIHRTIGNAKACDFQSKVNKAMDVLGTFHSAANGVEWYERTPNDANRLNLMSYDSLCDFVIHHCHVHNPPVISGSEATRWGRSDPPRRFPLHPGMTDPHHSCSVLSNTLTDFLEG
ncbi:hypothetical protein TNCV_4814111 [Trichonephila clavipes]|nr:hypothetical protein TNCV_4814111 [Trichonephila clavipes]